MSLEGFAPFRADAQKRKVKKEVKLKVSNKFQINQSKTTQKNIFKAI
jgi:hypothetical protein